MREVPYFRVGKSGLDVRTETKRLAMLRVSVGCIVVCFVVFALACGGYNASLSDEESVITDNKNILLLDVVSNSLPEDEFIHSNYTCDLDDISPHLKWGIGPDNTKSFAIVFDDPDTPFAPPFVHWVVYGIPSGFNEFQENVPKTEVLANGIKQGVNDFGNIGYAGPCPPGAGKIHTWTLKVYALDIDVDLNSGATKTELLEIISGHILAEGEIARKYRTSTGCMYCAVTPSEDSTGQNKEAGLGKRTVNEDK